ncbi:TonB-dependent receptor plug domain-containing protein [Dysgonomonadaceae bacterium zrk40]|nr:TonB-dependent receptor plug domain-containing protein [Dysgonomonadaceae bacterium zrk40]
MENLLYYLLRASVSMVLFYSFYKLFFGKNTFHAINRFVLIALVLLTVLLPLFRFNLLPELSRMTISDHPTWDLSNIPITEFSSMTATQPMFPWRTLLLVVFVVGFLFAVLRYLIGFLQIIGIIRNSHKVKLYDGSTLCLSAREIAPFSWVNYVVLHCKDIPEENRAIIQHEQAHIHLKHSFDMLFIDLFTSFFWFNPFSWLLRREIRSVHEYQADAQVLNEGVEMKQYQLLLIRKSVGEQKFALANNFRQRDLHKRIQMMMKQKSDKQTKWSYVAAFPLLFLVMVALSVPKLNASIPDKAIEKSHEKAVKEGESIILSEDFVEFSNGSLELGKVRIVAKDSISVSGKVRDQADSTHTQEIEIEHTKMEDVKVIGYGLMNQKDPISIVSVDGEGAQPLYILDGEEVESVSEINPDLIQAIEVLKDYAATEKFGERGKEGVIIITTKKDVKKTFDFNDENNPLLILDGVIQDAAFELNSVSPDEIESIEVLKGNSAVKLYGEKGKNGVILIHRKKKVE